MCEEHLYWAIIDNRWMIDANFQKGPRAFFDDAPAPLRPLIIAMVRRQVRRDMRGHGMGRHSRAEIERLAGRSIDAIAQILGSKPWLMGEEPTSVDASAWSFLTSAMCPYFGGPIAAGAERHANLVAYRDRGMQRWFPELKAP